jgi:uncharacterized iron-regulated membrane protein
MSDYLWDKKGEPDTDVARLEALLGTFAHEPRPLELPAEAVTHEPRPARLPHFAPRLRASRPFAPAALAAAAALVVATVLVASAFLRARTANEEGHAATREASQPKDDARKDERPQPPVVERGMLEPPPGAVNDKKTLPNVKVKDERVAVENLPRVVRRRKDAQPSVAASRRQKVPDVDAVQDGAGANRGLTLEALSARGGAWEFVESTRLLTKEQLVYALRLTGAKLRDVREKAQGMEGSRQ